MKINHTLPLNQVEVSISLLVSFESSGSLYQFTRVLWIKWKSLSVYSCPLNQVEVSISLLVSFEPSGSLYQFTRVLWIKWKSLSVYSCPLNQVEVSISLLVSFESSGSLLSVYSCPFRSYKWSCVFSANHGLGYRGRKFLCHICTSRQCNYMWHEYRGTWPEPEAVSWSSREEKHCVQWEQVHIFNISQ